MEKGDSKGHKEDSDGPPSYEETMRRDAIQTQNSGHTHQPKATSRKGYPGGERLTYNGSKNGK